MKLRTVVTLAIAAGAALAGGWFVHLATRAPPPPPGALVERVKQVARLQALEVRLSTTVEHEPDPEWTPSLPGQVLSWALHTLRARRGTAIVGGVANLGLDLSQLEASAFEVQGGTVHVVLPQVRTVVELDLERTRIVHSNLDSEQTAELLEKGRRQLQMQVERDEGLRDKARTSAHDALRAMLRGVGFRQVVFVERLASPGGA